MNPGRFYVPGYMGIRNIPMTASMSGIANSMPRSMGLFGRITNSIRSVNWGGLLNGANKTLNVVNQAIPLVRQAGPMVNNMKNMFRIAKAFGTETNGRNISKNNINKTNNNIYNNRNDMKNINITKDSALDTSPNFFV